MDLHTPRSNYTPRSTRSTPGRPSKWSKFQEKISLMSRPQVVEKTHSSPVVTRIDPHDSSFGTNQLLNLSNYSDTGLVPEHRTTSIARTTPISKVSTPIVPPQSRVSQHSSIPLTPPQVSPYLHSKSSTPRKQKNYSNQKCCFCEELLSSRLKVEKIIELACGHTCHEECLWLLISDQQNTSNELHKLFPRCELCDKVAIPQDDELRDSFISRYLINSPQALPAPSPKAVTTTTRSPPPQPQQDDQNSKFHTLSLQSKNSKYLSIEIPGPEPRQSQYRDSQHRYRRHKSRGSSISAISSIVSSVPKSPSPTNERFPSYDISLALLRSEHISRLIHQLQNHGQTITEADIDALGVLRLVDTLSISYDEADSFRDIIAYLFQNSLMIVSQSYDRMKFFPLINVRVATPNHETLRLQLANSTFFIRQRESKILEKWIAGLCDMEQLFNSTKLSSTITPQDEIVAPQSIDDQLTLPVLLSPLKFTPVGTPSSPVTPLEFHKPRHLVLCIDHEKPMPSSSIMTAQNIARVISTRFDSFRLICSKNSLSDVYINGDARSIDQIGNPLTYGSPVNEILTDLKLAEDTGLCILTTGVKQKTFNELPIRNVLILQIGVNQPKKCDSVLAVPSWDEVMQCLIMKYGITFGETMIGSDGELGDDLNSDFDSDFDSDFEDGRPSMNTSSEQIASPNSTLDSNTPRVIQTGFAAMQGDSTAMADDLNTIKTADSTRDSIVTGKESTRWSKLFQDIDEALNQTMI
ncbi:CYFA0S20e01200g1_1 [Cyberlindnera fabianii]|uniref:CYFA0S20e01200g1_1 n=1 Tax=Cyberlindnera fabianii TaxID=36022 RepID=A0A061BFX9_CYBFA|nr:CYFA0S20e01200g1_1 [Cyberlindnera fabianii]